MLLALPAVANPPQPVAPPTASGSVEFIANRRQWEPAVLFAADVPSGRLFLEKGRLVQALYDGKQVDELHHNHAAKAPAKPFIKGHAYSTTFVGASVQAAVRGEAQLPGYTSYFLGNDKSRWASQVPGYEGVRYAGLYPGIDLHFYSKERALEYDFEVAAGADAGRIALRYAGQTQLRVVDGALHIGTSVGTVVEQRPYAYQVVQGQRQQVACDYALGAQGTVTFRLPAGYDHTLPLVIDPVLVYATYTGSSASNYGYTATYDSLGNVYSGGSVFSAGYPTTMGAYDASFNGSTDMGLIKYNPNAATGAASRVWATYVGGQSSDQPHSLVVDHHNNLVIMGTTSSNNYPTTTGAYDTSLGGTTDLVITKLNPTGSALVGSTYLGGTDIDGQTHSTLRVNYGDGYRGDVTIDKSDNIYLASMTSSTNFPVTAGAPQPAIGGGGADGVVSKLSANLTALTWSTYLGGNGVDAAYSIQLDSVNNVFVGGGTTSPNLPGTAGAFFNARPGGTDGFISRISASGTTLVRTTYLGTIAYDQVYIIQLDKQGNVYAFGQTAGNYTVSAGVYSNAGSRQFLHKLNAQLTTSIFSTVIGNGATTSPCMSPTALLVTDCGQILLSGWTLQSGMPTTPDAIQATAGSGTSSSTSSFSGWFYIAQLAPNAQALTYGTYYGNGTCHVDGGTSRFDKKGTVYQSICVGSGTSLITSTNAWSRTIGTSYNNATFKMDVARPDASFTTSNAPRGPVVRTGCAPIRFYFDRGTAAGTTSWNFGNGQTSTLATGASALYTVPGTYIVRLTVGDPTSCGDYAVSVDTVKVYGLPRAAAGPDQTICQGSSVTLTAASAGAGSTYTWSPAAGLNTTSGPTVQASPTVTTQYIVRVTTPNNCAGADTVQVLVAPAPRIAATASVGTAFTGTAIAFTSTAQAPVATYQWNFGDGQTSTQANPSHPYTLPGTYQVRLTVTFGANCTETALLPVVIRKFEQPNVITPNADGLNDTFRPLVSLSKVDIQIFNRWGRQVYAKQDYTDSWGSDPNIAAGNYFYRLVNAAGESWQGWVEVIK